MRLNAAFLLAWTSVATAQTPDLLCEGFAPDWRIEGASTVELTWIEPVELDVMHTALGENDPDIRAYTLVGLRDSAILITEAETCEIRGAAWDYQATLLTQRGQTPVVLTGCCMHRPD